MRKATALTTNTTDTAGPTRGSTPLAFNDGETTGLDHEVHQMWELAMKMRDHRQPALDGEWLWQLHVDEARADPQALKINGFHERYQAHNGEVLVMACPPRAVELMPALDLLPAHWKFQQLAAQLLWLFSPPPALELASASPEVYAGKHRTHWLGAVPDFDVRFVTAFMRAHGALPNWPHTPWHYHLGDVENLAAGRLRQPPPWDPDDLSARLGVHIDPQRRHTALGDVRWAEQLYDAVMAPDTVELYRADGTRHVYR